MTKLKKLLIAAVLMGASFALQPPVAEAINWCNECDVTGDCFACCKCDGGTTAYCARYACP